MLLEAKDIGFRYGKKEPWILQNVTISIKQGERVGIVGPSGYGKSTLCKLLAGYEKPSRGEILLNGKPLPDKGVNPVSLICQHPEKAINPRWKMRQVLEESGIVSREEAGTEKKRTMEEIMKSLGIERDWLTRYPRELSGGELQRFCVARSLFEGAHFLLADEMSTMLDVITQAQIWNFMLKEVEERNLGLLVVTHNRALADRVCTRVVDLTE